MHRAGRDDNGARGHRHRKNRPVQTQYAVGVGAADHIGYGLRRGRRARCRATALRCGCAAIGVGQAVVERAGTMKACRERRRAPVRSTIRVRAAGRKPAVCERISRGRACGGRRAVLRRNIGAAELCRPGAAAGTATRPCPRAGGPATRREPRPRPALLPPRALRQQKFLPSICWGTGCDGCAITPVRSARCPAKG